MTEDKPVNDPEELSLKDRFKQRFQGKSEDAVEQAKEVEKKLDAIEPIVESVAPIVEAAVSVANPVVGSALKTAREKGKSAKPLAKGLLGLTHVDAWVAEGEEVWEALGGEVHEKLGLGMLTSRMAVEGGVLYRVVTTSSQGNPVASVSLVFVPTTQS